MQSGLQLRSHHHSTFARMHPNAERQREYLWQLHSQGYDTSGLFSKIGHAFSSAAKGVAKATAKVTKVALTPVTASVNATTKLASHVPILGSIVGAVNDLALAPINITQQVLEGGRIDKVALANFKKALDDVKTVGPWIQTVISFVPGIGTGISAAIGAGLALANGKSLSEALIAGVKGAIPGGPAAQIAFSVAQGAIERKPIDQIAIGALPISDQQKQLLTQGLAAVKDIVSGKNVAHSIVDHAISSLPPQYAKAVQIGMAVGHAKSLQDAVKAGVIGAASISGPLQKLLPSGVSSAISTGANLAKTSVNIAKNGVSASSALALGSAVAGKVAPHNVNNVVNTALSLAKNGASKAAITALAKQNLTPKAAIALAQKNLPASASAALSNAISAAKNGVPNPMRSPTFQRPGSIPIINIARQVSKLSAVPSATKAVVDAIKANPALMATSRQLLAQGMRTNGATVNDAIGIISRQRGLLPWRSMAPNTVTFIRKYAPNAPLTALRHAHTDVGGLDSTGTVYIVEKGDGPWAIANKLVKNGNRWKELLDYNKDKKPTVDKNIWVGEKINLPPSWQKPVAQTSATTTALPSVPSPTIAPTPDPVTQVTTAATSVVPSILQAKAILAAWGKTDGINQGVLSDYGLNAADMSTTMGARDTQMLQSFQVWDNKTLNEGLPVDGNLDSKSLTALQAWAAARATAATSTTTTAATPTVTATPAATQVIPTVVGGTDSSTASATPTVAAKTSTASSGSSAGTIAIGAVIGGLLFGLPGALVGAAGGAAIS